MCNRLTKSLLICSLFIMTACSGSEVPAEKDSGTTVEVNEKPAGVIPAHQLKALEKAKSVESLLQQTEQERRAKLEESTQ